jgi:DNA-binding transcriptional LysR family regulator
MDFHGLDLNLLVALDALLAEKNVTRAGARIHLSQPSTSGALGRLREYFKDQLLVSVGRKMLLTPLAQSMVKPVGDVLRQIEATITTTPQFDPATSTRQFMVLSSDYVTAVFLPRVLRIMKRRAPGMTFEIRPMIDRALEELDSDAEDMIIIPDAYASDRHPKQFLFDETYACIAWTGNSQVRHRISLAQYTSLGHVVVRIGITHPASFEEWFLNRMGYKRRIEVIAPTFEALPHLIEGTDRIATVHTRLAVAYRKYLPIKVVPLPIKIPTMGMVCQWHESHDADPGHAWVRGVLREVATRLGRASSHPSR